jgi:hypothetical protein
MQPPDLKPTSRPTSAQQFFTGLALVFLLHIFCTIGLWVLWMLSAGIFGWGINLLLLAIVFPMFGLGAIQAIYVLPAATTYFKRQNKDACVGVITAAVLTVLANAYVLFLVNEYLQDPSFLSNLLPWLGGGMLISVVLGGLGAGYIATVASRKNSVPRQH